MAWIYAAESAQSAKPWRPGCGQSPIVKSTLRPGEFFCPANIEAKSTLHQCGMTFELFEDSWCRELILSPQVFPARTSRLPDVAKAWRASKAQFFGKLSDLPLKQKRLLFFSKTSGPVFGNLSRPSEMRLKVLDTSAGTVFFPPPTSELGTSVSDGSCWPTSTASRAGWQCGGPAGRKRPKRYSIESLWKMGRLPTLTAREWRSAGHASDLARKNPSVSTYWKETTGTNMPASFCEWIMGFRIGATAFEPWAIPIRPRSTGKRSKSSQDSKGAT